MVVLIMRGVLHTCGLAALLILAAVPPGWAADGDRATVVDTSVYGREGWLYADIQFRDILDARTTSTVDSGLSGVCLYEVQVLDDRDQEVGWSRWQFHLEHDLWEDRYLVRGVEGEWALPSLAAMDSLCSDIDARRLAPLSKLQADREYRLVIKVVAQPLADEDRARLSSFISRRDHRDREELDFDLGSIFGSLFTGGDGRRTALDYTGRGFRPRALEQRP